MHSWRMSEESELGSKRTALVRGTIDTKMGTAIMTTQRVVFFDEDFSTNAAFGAVAGAITGALQKRHEEGGPLLQFPLDSITKVAREKKLLNQDRIRITTSEASTC